MNIQITDGRIRSSQLKPATVASAGIDLYACIDETTYLEVDEKIKINSGIKVSIPEGWVGVVVPRSSTGYDGKWLANVVGVIDSDYRGEVIVAIKNTSRIRIAIKPMDRIAQMVVVPHYNYNNISFVNSIASTDRGDGGFGSTGE